MKGSVRTGAACLLLAAATLALYGPAVGHGFVHFDDHLYVTDNPNVQAGLSWQTVRWALTVHQPANWHPLTLLSHALDCELFGLEPAGHHATSVLLHALNAVLLFLLLARATGAPGRSWLVAALFAFHPLNVESVAWVAERKNLLSTLLMLVSLAAWGWYARRPGLARYLLAALSFALGLAAKPMLVTLPCALLLLDGWPLGRLRGGPAAAAGAARPQRSALGLALEKLPLLALSALDSWATLAAQQVGLAFANLQEIPFSVRLENAAHAYGAYLWKAVWPTRLSVLYLHPGDALPFWRVGAALALLAALGALAWRERRRRPYLLAGWLWYLGTLVPVIGLVQVGDQAMADRFAYVPLLGPFVMAVWAAAEFAERARLALPLRAGAAALVLALLAAQSARQVGVWRSNLDLWLHAVEVTRGNHVAEINAAFALEEAGRRAEALPHYVEAARLQPRNPEVRYNLASALARAGRLGDAIVEYDAVVAIAQDPALRAIALADLGTAHRKRGDAAKARELYEQALRLDPRLPTALRGVRQLEAGEERAESAR
jgi:tetratricopeptide (TPR) repeat protein